MLELEGYWKVVWVWHGEERERRDRRVLERRVESNLSLLLLLRVVSLEAVVDKASGSEMGVCGTPPLLAPPPFLFSLDLRVDS